MKSWAPNPLGRFDVSTAETTATEPAPVVRQLTARQREILEFMYETVERDGYRPSIRDICRRFNVTSINGTQSHLRALEKKGYLSVTHKADHQSRINGSRVRFLRLPDGRPFRGFWRIEG
jgi:DNA-binding MarR family transcriptional regulator